MHIGLYFGSFNPIHHGHLIIASYCCHKTDLEQVWLILSPLNPLKPSASLLNEYDRLHLVNLAIENDLKLQARDVEFRLPKPSYTVHTLAYLQEKYPDHTFSIIMGADSLSNLPQWKNSETIINNHHLYVFRRPGFALENPTNAHYTLVEAPLLDISSTQIRNFIKEGIPVRYMIPDKVAEEIERNNYYR